MESTHLAQAGPPPCATAGRQRLLGAVRTRQPHPGAVRAPAGPAVRRSRRRTRSGLPWRPDCSGPAHAPERCHDCTRRRLLVSRNQPGRAMGSVLDQDEERCFAKNASTCGAAPAICSNRSVLCAARRLQTAAARRTVRLQRQAREQRACHHRQRCRGRQRPVLRLHGYPNDITGCRDCQDMKA